MFENVEEYKVHLRQAHGKIRDGQMVLGFNHVRASSALQEDQQVQMSRPRGGWADAAGGQRSLTADAFPPLQGSGLSNHSLHSQSILRQPPISASEPVAAQVAAPVPAAPLRTVQPIIDRNRRLADAFGISTDARGGIIASSDIVVHQSDVPQPTYSDEMIDWGRTKFRQLKSLEKRIHDMLQDSSRNSLQLRPMSADQVSLSTIFATFF